MPLIQKLHKTLGDKQSTRVVVKDLGGESISIYDDNFVKDDQTDQLLPYEPIAVSNSKPTSISRNSDNQIKPALNLERERESISSTGRSNGASKNGRVAASTAAEVSSPNANQFGSIAFNSREVRFVGPNQKEVEMKDDMASKVVVVLDNLQKEAGEVWDQVNDKLDKGWKDIKRSEVWGQVNDKLDKSWTDLKTMVEGVISSSTSKRQP